MLRSQCVGMTPLPGREMRKQGVTAMCHQGGCPPPRASSFSGACSRPTASPAVARSRRADCASGAAPSPGGVRRPIAVVEPGSPPCIALGARAS